MANTPSCGCERMPWSSFERRIDTGTRAPRRVKVLLSQDMQQRKAPDSARWLEDGGGLCPPYRRSSGHETRSI